MSVSASGSRTWPEGLMEFGGNFRVILHPGVSLAGVEVQPGLEIKPEDRTIVVEDGLGLVSRFGVLFVASLRGGGRSLLCFKRSEVKSVNGADGSTTIWPKEPD
jgi:hypothetical protein